MHLSELYSLYNQHPVVTTDSRNCPVGSLFFALKGASFDGNLFAEKALQLGCAYAIIDNPSVQTNERMILVDDVLQTLQQLAALHRKTLAIPVIGITGTNGKTTTKELTSAVLSRKYNTLFTQGNLNNHIGVPLTLLRLSREHEIAVIEMGANHPGEIRELANIAQPNYGLITNVGYAHLEGFGSFEGVIRTKGELYEFIRTSDGKIFIHQDNKYLTDISEGIAKITYGVMSDVAPLQTAGAVSAGAKDAAGSETALLHIVGKATGNHPFLSFEWQEMSPQASSADAEGHSHSQRASSADAAHHLVNTRLVGEYNLWNALAAIAIGRCFDVEPKDINRALAEYEPTNNRSQLKKTAKNELIIDAYNANPSSMRAALENFATMQVARKAVILGDMRELGKDSAELHAEIVRLASSLGIDKLIFCGKEFSAVAEGHICFSSVETLADYIDANPLQGYCILLKGSRGIHLEKITDKL